MVIQSAVGRGRGGGEGALTPTKIAPFFFLPPTDNKIPILTCVCVYMCVRESFLSESVNVFRLRVKELANCISIKEMLMK